MREDLSFTPQISFAEKAAKNGYDNEREKLRA
jgi:hypothetical protein